MRLSTPREEFFYAVGNRGVKNDVLTSPVVISKGEGLRGDLNGVKYAVIIHEPELVRNGRLRQTVIARNLRTFLSKERTIILEPDNIRPVNYEGDVIRYDPEDLHPEDGMPNGNNPEGAFRFYLKPGIRSVVLTTSYYLEATRSVFDRSGSVFDRKPDGRLSVKGDSANLKRLFRDLMEKGYLIHILRQRGDRASADFSEALAETGIVEPVTINEKRFLKTRNRDEEGLVRTSVAKGTLEPFYLVD